MLLSCRNLKSKSKAEGRGVRERPSNEGFQKKEMSEDACAMSLCE